MKNFGTDEQIAIVIAEAKKKAKKEFYSGLHSRHFDLDMLEVFLTNHALKEIQNFTKGDKGDNFLRYIRQ
ncbi:hypothetical protein QUF99_16880 [Bacillus sp. DX4.1]|uniref:hypothetical protein n=1 Tax=Bacillus sp. DX4.1 TaxID=3055867 RepID=UPI0025A0185B|nr:hypothetical protein [Bacillus sp. DX4.1]MDM5188930.1 hypothetical protein [Bacillus sp. DX4.1]